MSVDEKNNMMVNHYYSLSNYRPEINEIWINRMAFHMSSYRVSIAYALSGTLLYYFGNLRLELWIKMRYKDIARLEVQKLTNFYLIMIGILEEISWYRTEGQNQFKEVIAATSTQLTTKQLNGFFGEAPVLASSDVTWFYKEIADVVIDRMNWDVPEEHYWRILDLGILPH